MIARAPGLARRLGANRSGLAMVEFALSLPIFMALSTTGIELTNYITFKMRVSQLALHVADNAARIGTGSQLAAKTIYETDINDLFAGAEMQSGGLDVNKFGRIVLTDLEPTASPNTNSTYKVGWQRCYGTKTVYPFNSYTQNLAGGIGPSGRKVAAQDYNATMFVEVYYVYQPLISGSLAPTTTFTEIASMAVRDRRDLASGLQNPSNAPVATCT